MRLTDDQVAELVALWDEDLAGPGVVYKGGKMVPSPPQDRICDVMAAPVPTWLFDLLGITRTVNLIRYRQGGHCKAHTDAAEGRKTTTIIGLTDDYDGGHLEVAGQRMRLEVGQVVTFPADTMHRVWPVTRGSRMVAVGWVF